MLIEGEQGEDVGVRLGIACLHGRCGTHLGLEEDAVPDAPKEGKGPPGGRSSRSSSEREAKPRVCRTP